MDGEQRFYQRPWFLPVAWTVASLIWYAAQLYRMRLGLMDYTIYLTVDAILFAVGLFLWMVFFSQFILPVFRFRERQKIFDRLVSHAFGGHGPAIFVEDGVPVAATGEKEKRGAGVLWLDSASAVQLRTNFKFTRTLGPGVHFTQNHEYIAGVVDLHPQVQGLGPIGQDKPFQSEEAAKADGKSDEEYKAIQKRRNETLALTRDGIEVVPNLSVTFKIDAAPAEGEGPGSRFGYRETAKAEDNPVFKAIVGEGVNPNLANLPYERQVVAWNKLPAILAADLWREYLSKFTLRDLFDPIHEIPPDKPAPLVPTLEETTALFEPITASTRLNAWQDSLAELIHEINRMLAAWVKNLERASGEKSPPSRPPPAPPPMGAPTVKTGTALEVINAMVKARMTQAKVEELDANGKRSGAEIESPEFKWLQSRGLKIISASVSNLRFAQAVEEQLVRQWNATWLTNAKKERVAIELMRKKREMAAQVFGRDEFIHDLSRNLFRAHPSSAVETLDCLLTLTRDELSRFDRLQRRLGSEISGMEEIIQWARQESEG
ncbi:MAG: hypothetical protein AB1750_20270 [Chloroflexota bacterium]